MFCRWLCIGKYITFVKHLQAIINWKGGGKLYEKLMKLLEKEDKTPYRVAHDIGISEVLFSHWKSGRNKPSLDTLKKLAEYFDVDINYFLE